MKILVNAMSGIGDALMFSPSLKVLKEQFPDSTIDMLVMFKSVQETYRYSPHLNQIHYIDFLKQPKLKSIRELGALRAQRYDYSINIYPSNRLEYNVVNFFLGARKRIAFHYRHSSIFSAEFLNQILIKEENNIHNVLQNSKIIEVLAGKAVEVPPMELFLSEEKQSNGNAWVKEINPQNKLLVGFHAGSSTLKNHIHKRWAFEKYAELGNRLVKEKNALVLLFGNEFDLNEEIIKRMGGGALIASTSDYMDSMARMKHCGLFVSNDTAFLHTASAFQIPTVAIFAYTNYRELYPWKTKHIIVRKELSCSPCFYNSPKPAQCIWTGEDEFKCIKTITTEEVFQACEKMLSE